MPASGFFFRKDLLGAYDIGKPLYTYLGYVRKSVSSHGERVLQGDHAEQDKNLQNGLALQGREDPEYPISLYFGRNEISIYYTTSERRTVKIFTLCVAGGEINQRTLQRKIEDYSLIPLLQLSQRLISDESASIHVDPSLLQLGYFASYYGFKFDMQTGEFFPVFLPGSRTGVIRTLSGGKELRFAYSTSEGGRKDAREDEWKVSNEGPPYGIEVSCINFSKILLDFLFEMDFSNTFEDRNYLRLQPVLQNNLLLSSFAKKCRFLFELDKTTQQNSTDRSLPKPFKDAEKAWLDVCRLDTYRPVFESPHSLFDDPETEVEKTILRARIGKGGRTRLSFLTRKEDAQIRNDLCTFFMRKYCIWTAFRTVLPMWMPPWAVVVFPVVLLLIPFGDYLFSSDYIPVGTFSIGIPVLMVAITLIYKWKRGVNLFRLLLPRLFLGIMLGWAIFWSSEELWKRALSSNLKGIILLDLFLLTVIVFYVFTDIDNHLYRRPASDVLWKTCNLTGMALLISLLLGFYVIQFHAVPMIENSGFLGNSRLYEGAPFQEAPCLDQFFAAPNLKPDIKEIWPGRLNYRKLPIQFPPFLQDASLRYIWSILLMQSVVAILVGLVLQLIWEDRPITEPL